MPKLAANLSMLFTELSFLDRFGAAARAGFFGVEYLFPYEHDPAEIAARLADLGLIQVLFNCPAGDFAAGERGLAALPDRIAECREGVRRAVDYAARVGCPRLHLMAGFQPPDVAAEVCLATLAENAAFAARLAAPLGIEILLEPINSRVDMPGYVLDTTAKALAVIAAAGEPNVRLQYDIYHMQIMEGDLARTIARLLPAIGHMQLADTPGRHEPGTGEINYSWLLGEIDRLGYEGWIGCEYRPKAATMEGLGWAKAWLA